MRVAIVINTSWNIYNFRRELVESLVAAGHEVIAIAPIDAFSEKLKELGCEYIPIQMSNKGTNPISDILLFLRLIKLYRKSGAEVFLQYTIKPNIYGSLAAKWIRKKSICNVSGLGTIFLNPDRMSSKIAMMLYRRAFKYPKKVFFQNPDDRNLFIEKGLIKPEICDVLPGSGVNLEYFKKNSGHHAAHKHGKEERVFLMISRLLKDKGIVEYFKAGRRLKQEFPGVRIQVLGKMDMSKGSISNQDYEFWKKSGIIEIIGEVQDVRPYIDRANCVVLPSYREGTPKSLLEAMSMSKPIVTTRVPGCKETVENEKNGYLCEVKSDDSLYDCMQKIMAKSQEELNAMGEESRRIAERKFDYRFVVDKYLKEIDGINKN